MERDTHTPKLGSEFQLSSIALDESHQYAMREYWGKKQTLLKSKIQKHYCFKNRNSVMKLEHNLRTLFRII